MQARRAFRLVPRRLRWRLVLGFALTVALLQVVLTGAERLLVQQALVSSIQQNLEQTVSAGLAGPAFSQGLVKDFAFLNGAAGTSRMITMAASSSGKMPTSRDNAHGPTKVDKQAPDVVTRMTLRLLTAADVASRVFDLTAVLALPDQPVAMLDAHGHVLARASTLAQDRKRTRPLASTVLDRLLAAATSRVATVTQPWTTQVNTPDGPYLMVLWPTEEPVLEWRVTKEEISKALPIMKMMRGNPKALQALLDPTVRAALQNLHPSHLVVLIAHRLGETQQTVGTVTAISLGGALAVIALAALVSLLLVGRALRPLAAITRGAERLAQGDYRYRLALDTGTDEVGRLAAAFDRMAAAIGAAFATQRRFVADASHELRTPLTALRGYTDVLLMGVDEDRATADRVLQAMQEDLGRMSRLVNDLLILARLDGGAALQVETVGLDDLLDAAAQEGRAIARDTMQIIAEPVPKDLAVLGDRDRLRQVLSNIVGNSCAYCPPCSTVWLRAEAFGRWAAITVRDNGPGILAADLARLGERFYRGDAARSRRTGGTGLGLAIARSIVQAHGGTLSIESALGAGTTVTIRLPLAPRTSSTPISEPPARPASAVPALQPSSTAGTRTPD